jgi:hypothetical protein
MHVSKHMNARDEAGLSQLMLLAAREFNCRNNHHASVEYGQ